MVKPGDCMLVRMLVTYKGHGGRPQRAWVVLYEMIGGKFRDASKDKSIDSRKRRPAPHGPTIKYLKRSSPHVRAQMPRHLTVGVQFPIRAIDLHQDKTT